MEGVSSCSESSGACEDVPAVPGATLTGPDAGPAVFIGSSRREKVPELFSIGAETRRRRVEPPRVRSVNVQAGKCICI